LRFWFFRRRFEIWRRFRLRNACRRCLWVFHVHVRRSHQVMMMMDHKQSICVLSCLGLPAVPHLISFPFSEC
jgi:hypothetical protein